MCLKHSRNCYSPVMVYPGRGQGEIQSEISPAWGRVQEGSGHTVPLSSPRGGQTRPLPVTGDSAHGVLPTREALGPETLSVLH